MLAASALQAQSLLRMTTHFQWSVLPILLLVLYAYSEQIAYQRWRVVLGGVTFWLMDWLNEIANSLVAHFSGYAPVWSTPQGESSLQLLVGLNIEISLMFAVMGLMAVRILPARRDLRILGMNNRLLIAVVSACLCTAVECGLHHIGVLAWEWQWWQCRTPWLIFLVGYLPFFLVAYWVHDMPSLLRQLKTVIGLAVLVGLLLLGFGRLAWL